MRRGDGTALRASARLDRLVNSASSLEAIEGVIRLWPLTTERMAPATSSIEISLRRYPAAPALMAS